MKSLRGALSLCLIARDEERNLPRCLDSVRGLVDEIILVDTGSIDATPDVAAQHGATVLTFDFTRVDFARARNLGLSHASGAWILVLDADETLDSESAPIVRRLLALNENAAYFLERHNRSSASETAAKDYVVRLFPNRADYRYHGRVHETIDASIIAGGGRLQQTGIRIDHNFSIDPEARRRKNLRYIEILKEEITADPLDHSRLDFLAAEYHQLGMFEQATEVAEQIVRARPLDPRAHLFLGVYHLLYCPDLKQARANLTRALELKPGYVEAKAFLQQLGQREQTELPQPRQLPDILL